MTPPAPSDARSQSDKIILRITYGGSGCLHGQSQGAFKAGRAVLRQDRGEPVAQQVGPG
ncbi:MAG: hypothetical protein R3E60_07795 [Alphaproteobacteria bacterium]